ncbi:hypothetical protein MMC07_000879 [Pseudocyphellaria aurata]|nr:hypothetical protein [Pseudocyphellaria aurata]
MGIDITDDGDVAMSGILKERQWKVEHHKCLELGPSLEWFDELVKNPQEHGIDPEYVDLSDTVTDGKHMKLQFVVEYIRHLRVSCLISDGHYHKLSGDPSQGSFTWLYPRTTYAGCELPVRTLFDAVGWILFITVVPVLGS